MMLAWFQPFTVLPFLLFVLFLYKWLHTKSTPTKNYPPSPPKLPILGNLHQLGNHPHRSLRSLSRRYGDLMFVYMGSRPALIVSSDKAAREIMKTQDTIFSNRPSTKTVEKLLYNRKDVASANYGEYWRQMKSICILQLLGPKRVRSFRSVREEETSFLIEMIKRTSSKESKPVNLSEMLVTFTSNVICKVAFGRKYSQTGGGTEFNKLLKEFIMMLGTFRVGDFSPRLGWTNRIDGWDRKVDRVAKEFDEFLEDVVKEHEDRRRGEPEGEEKADNEKVKDFVDVLLDVREEKTTGFAIERDSIKGIILDMFSGGTDTSYTVLEWAMTELLRHPKVMQELQKEVTEITGAKAQVNEDDLKQMNYLKAVLKETLRLHPPIPLLVPRLSLVDSKINGYDIPAGIAVIINAWAIQTDPASWEEPEMFNPERFLNCPTDFKGQDFELIPFGSGRRICPGILFAMSNNELALASLIHKFDWTLPGGAKGEALDTSECVGLTIHRKTPLVVVATPTVTGE